MKNSTNRKIRCLLHSQHTNRHCNSPMHKLFEGSGSAVAACMVPTVKSTVNHIRCTGIGSPIWVELKTHEEKYTARYTQLGLFISWSYILFYSWVTEFTLKMCSVPESESHLSDRKYFTQLMSFAGCQSQDIVILVKLFQDFQSIMNFRLGIVAQVPGGTAGIAYIEILANTPPSGGTCSVTPRTGTALQTLFYIFCSGWADSNGIKLYQFNSKRSFWSTWSSICLIICTTQRVTEDSSFCWHGSVIENQQLVSFEIFLQRETFHWGCMPSRSFKQHSHFCFETSWRANTETEILLGLSEFPVTLLRHMKVRVVSSSTQIN